MLPRQDFVQLNWTSPKRIHRNRMRPMTTTASATRVPEAEISGAHAVRQLDIGLAHVAAGRIDEASLASDV